MGVLNLKNAASLDKLTKAFPYQLEAIDLVHELPYAAIFFEQGLGKTKIAIDLILDWLSADIVDSAIVVTKKGLVQNWVSEFAIHSHIKPRILSSDRAANHRAYFSPSRVYVANYEAISLEQDRIRIFARQRRLAVILDESHKIKNPNSRLAESFIELSEVFKKKVIMSGTPMANRPYDIWSQIYFLDGGKSLGSDFKRFKDDLDLPDQIDADYLEVLSNIFPAISEFSLRQTKEGSGLNLTGKIYKNIYSDWEIKQREMYETIRDDLRILVVKQGRALIDDSEALLKRLLRLVQVTSNPLLIDESYEAIPGKISVLSSLIEDIVGNNEKVIIWTSFVENCSYLKKRFIDYGVVMIHGRMAISDRNNSVDRFKNDPNVKILIATPSAAKEGLTLTIANHVIFYDRSFSLDDYLQAQDRIHRISQEKICYVYNITMNDSIDEWVSSLISLKSAVAKVGMMDSNEEELEEAFSVNIKEILASVLGDNNDELE